MRNAGLRGLAALPRRTRTTDSRHGYPIAPNRLGRNFTASAPNQILLADLTYIPTGEGWLYLAAILDMHTRKIVGWSMRETLHTEIALEALDMAIRASAACTWINPPFRSRHSGRIQAVVATGCLLVDRRSSSSASAGVFHSRVLRGLVLSAAATAAISSTVCTLRSVPFGKY